MSQKFERSWNALVIVLQSIVNENIDEIWPFVAGIFETKYKCDLLQLPLCEPRQFFKDGKTEGHEEDLYRLALDIRHFVTVCRKRDHDSNKKVLMSVSVLRRLTSTCFCLNPTFKEGLVKEMLEELAAEDETVVKEEFDVNEKTDVKEESNDEDMILMENPHYMEFYEHVLQMP